MIVIADNSPLLDFEETLERLKKTNFRLSESIETGLRKRLRAVE